MRGGRYWRERGEPAETDDAEEEVGGVLRHARSHRQLITQCRESFLRRGDVWWHFFQLSAAGERLPFDQAHEVGPGREKVEIIGNRAGQDVFWFCRAGERACSPGPDRVQHFSEAALQHSAVELSLGAEEIPRGSAGDTGEGPTSLRLVPSYPFSAKSASPASKMASRERAGLRSFSLSGNDIGHRFWEVFGLLDVQQVNENPEYPQEKNLSPTLDPTYRSTAAPSGIGGWTGSGDFPGCVLGTTFRNRLR